MVRRPSDGRMSQILAEVGDASLTYADVTATAHPDDLPAGYHHVRAGTVLGRGERAFTAAVAGMRGWQLHRRQGFRVVPSDPPITVGTVVARRTPGHGGDVTLAITAFSRPRHPLVRLGGPIARWQQARATQGYLDALAAHVREATGERSALG